MTILEHGGVLFSEQGRTDRIFTTVFLMLWPKLNNQQIALQGRVVQSSIKVVRLGFLGATPLKFEN